MLIDLGFYFPVSLAMLQDVFHGPGLTEGVRTALRWFHLVGGITWIGLLYFFNLVNVPFQKNLDAETKKKVNPDLLSRALWLFRWSALLTVFVGLAYFAMYILAPAVNNANNLAAANLNTWLVLLSWLTYPVVLFVVEFLIIKKVPALTKNGWVFAVIMVILIGVTSYGLLQFFTSKLTVGSLVTPNNVYSIGLGGAYGIVMLLNVWGIIWPNNKRIIAGLQGGTPAAPELARQAFLASRTNAWLSLPMILFMATSEHDWVIFGGK